MATRGSDAGHAGATNGQPVALVTGANKGIGREGVRRLLDAGFHCYLGARDLKAGQAAADELQATFVQLDVTSDDSVEHAVARIDNDSGYLDVLVNNAGISGPLGSAADYTPADAQAVLATNVVGYVRMIHACLPLLDRSLHPRIVNVSSGLGSFGLFHDPSRLESRFGSPLYAASKAAINMLTARYAQLLPHIRINSVDPGLTSTDLSRGDGHSVSEGTDAMLACVIGASASRSGTFADRDGDLPW